MINNSDPTIEPCGTPQLLFDRTDLLPLKKTIPVCKVVPEPLESISTNNVMISPVHGLYTMDYIKSFVGPVSRHYPTSAINATQLYTPTHVKPR